MIGQVFDLEADGLKATKIHCLSVRTSSGVLSTTNYADMRTFFLNAKVLVGHNIIRYDIPTVERILGIKVKARLVDTLALSWYLEPQRALHGLESYGEDFGVPKPKIDDWLNLTEQEYVHRCEEDVKINSLLWEDQQKLLLNLYGTEKEALRLVEYLEFKMDCAADQEKYGWAIDTDKATKLMEQLTDEYNKKQEEIKVAMPPVELWKEKIKPRKLYKINGQLSEAGKDWFELLEKQGLPEGVDKVRYICSYESPNPSSHIQLKEWLYKLGWKPITFAYKKEKDGSVRKIPQIQQDKSKGPGLCQSVVNLFEREPKLEVLQGLSIISHRLGLVRGLLENVDENGYVQAQIAGLTNTLRFKHKVVVNLPGVDKPYGADIRGCLVAPKGYKLGGSDMSSLEDRTGRHYMFDYDPQYVEEMNDPEFDPHLDLAAFSKRLIPEQVKAYVRADDDFKHSSEYKSIKLIRGIFKTTNYACKYGAGGPKIALTLGIPDKEGYDLWEAYWERNWSVRSVADNTEVKVCNGGMWLFNPISKLWYSLRHQKDRFSTLNQGSGVWCFDLYVKHVRDNGPHIIGQFHDELIALVREGQEDRFRKHVREAIRKVNEELRLNVELDVGLDFGNSYSEIH